MGLSFGGLFENYIMAGMDFLGLQIDANLSEGRNYTILPASALQIHETSVRNL